MGPHKCQPIYVHCLPATCAAGAVYEPRNYLPRQTQAGCYRNEPATIDLYTIGFDSEGVKYNADYNVLAQRCHEMMKKKLHLDIPVHDVFNCLDLKGNVPKHHLWRCTGRNAKIFQSVWYHKNIRPLVRKVLRSYDEHNKNRNAGENYRAAFFCKSGNHRSVAVATGLQTMLIGMGYNVLVRMRHLSKEKGDWKRFCSRQTCPFCRWYPSRKAWEKNVVLKAR